MGGCATSIGFAGSCWRVIANGEDTGLVLFVRP
jgi:hypothetical protein